jgi:hypothetical protein
MATSVAYPSWLLMMLVFSGSPLNMPLSLPPLPEDPVLSHVAPEQCVWYMSLAGMDKASATSKNQAEQLLAEADVQNFVRSLTATVKNAITSGLQAEAPKDGYAEVPKLLETLLTRPLCIYLGAITPGPHGPTVRGGMVVNLGDKAADFETGLKKLLDLIPSNVHGGPKPSAVADTADGWHTLTLPQDIPVVLWAVKEKYLVVGFGEGEAQAIWARSQKSTPQWLTDVKSQLKVERPSMVQYVNLQVLEGMAQMALTVVEGPDRATDTLETFGLTNAKYFASVSGLDQKDFANRMMIATDGPPIGLLSLLDGKPLDADVLKSIPADATFAVAAKIEPVKILDMFMEVAAVTVAPGLIGQQGNGQKTKDVLNRQLDMMAGFFGFHPKNDLAASLGDTWCIYNSPGDGGLLVTGITVVGTLKDRQKILQINEKIIALYHQEMNPQNNPGTVVEDPAIADFEYRGQKINFLNFHNINAGSPLAPAWAITADKIVFGLYPQTIKAYLDRQASMAAGAKPAAVDGQSKQSLADLPEIAKLFAGGSAPRVIAYQDTPNLFKTIYPLLQVGAEFGFAAAQQNGVDLNISVLPSAASIVPHLTPNVCSIQSTPDGIRIDSHGSLSLGGGMLPVATALLLPATRSARGAAGENASMNNLKQIGLAMLDYEDMHHVLPPAYIADKDGKPLLSWRVMMLPMLEENDLYLQFHLDEPWDSEHNKALIEKMPAAYKAPGSKKEVVDQGKTVYQTVRADSTAFTGDKGKKLAAITDGTSKTIATVETSDDKAVIWTKPDDFELNDKDATGGLVGLRKGGFLAAFLDGHVEKIPENADPNAVKALFTRAGGEPVNPNNLPLQPQADVPRRAPAPANAAWVGGGNIVIQAAPGGGGGVALVQVNGAPVVPAAESKQSKSNLKQIGLALHSFYSTQKCFPAAFVTNEGKPTLSWRVMILPFIENGGADLYKQFHLNEPWDSENNKKLIEKMPDVFKAPGSKAAKEFKTVYLTPRGEGTAFPGEKPVSFKQVPDGSTSKTIAVMEAADDKAVIWTKPDDFDITQKDPIAGLVGLREGGFLTVFCDGSVHSIVKTIDTESLMQLFNRADGNNVDIGKFEQPADPKAMPPVAPAAAPALPLVPAAAPAR